MAAGGGRQRWQCVRLRLISCGSSGSGGKGFFGMYQIRTILYNIDGILGGKEKIDDNCREEEAMAQRSMKEHRKPGWLRIAVVKAAVPAMENDDDDKWQ